MAVPNLDQLAAEFLELDPSAMTPEGAGPAASSSVARQQNAELFNQGVALTKEGGAGQEPLGLRGGIALRRGENLQRFLDERVGPGNYRFNDDGRLILRNTRGQEYLADEIGITGADLVDFIDMGAPTIGAIGAAAAAPASAGVLGLAALSALGAAGAGSAVDVVTTSGSPGNWERAKEIFAERGPEAMLDFVLGVAGGKVTRLTSRQIPPPIEGVDPMADIPAQAVVEARDRLQQQAGTEIPLTVSEATGSPAAARAESIAGKLPASAGLFKDIRAKQDEALSRVQQTLVGDTETANKDAVRVLSDQADDLDRQATALVSEADSLLQQELADVVNVFGKGGENLTARGAGMIRRQAAIRARQAFRSTSQTLYKAAEKLGLNEVEVPSSAPLKGLVRRIEARLPKTEQVSSTVTTRTPVEGTTRGQIFRTESKTTESGGQVLNQLIPTELRGLLQQLKAIEAKPTYAEIKGLRNVINDAIDAGAAIPDAGQGVLKQISGTLTQMLVAAERDVKDPALRRALVSANNHYQRHVDQFKRVGIADSFVPSTEAGFVEDAAFARRLLSPDKVDELKAAMEFMSARERLGFTRGLWNDMVERSKSTLTGGQLSVDKLVSEIDSLSPATRKLLFGDQFTPIQNILRLMNQARTRELNVSDIADLDGPVADKLRQAARLQAQRVRDYDTKVLKPFLANRLSYAETNPDEFASHLLRNAELGEVQGVLKKLGTDSAEAAALKRRMVQEILNESQRGASPEEVIADLIREGQPLVGGRELLRTLTTIGGTNSRKKIGEILGPEAMQTLQDIGVFRAGQQRTTAMAGAAGGLISGNLMARLASGAYQQVLRISTVYRGLAALLTNPQALRYLRSTPKEGARYRAQTGLATVLNDLQRELADEPGAYEAFREALMGESADPGIDADPALDLEELARQFLEQ